MEWTQDQIAAVVGSQQLEIISLRMEVARLRAKYEPQPANVVPTTEAKDGAA